LKTLSIIFAIALFLVPAVAQASHSVLLTWTDTLNPATGTTYTVYRASGLCSGTPTFSKVATAVAVKTYTDSTVTPGNYCYQITASFGGAESQPSNSVNPSVGAFPPTGLNFTVQ
jgi:hypothetical protein